MVLKLNEDPVDWPTNILYTTFGMEVIDASDEESNEVQSKSNATRRRQGLVDEVIIDGFSVLASPASPGARSLY